LCYINSDIVLMPDFMTAVERCEQLKDQFLLCGRRWNLDVTDSIDFSEGWEERLRQRAESFGVLEEPWAIDYFVFTSKIGADMPPFIIGRPAWDNWFLYSARAEGYPLIDATQSILAIHQNHDYRHVPQGSGKTVDGPEAQINIKLAGQLACEISLKDATHTLINGQLKRTLDRESLIRKLDMTPRIKPWTAPFILLLRLLLRITKPVRVLISKPDSGKQ
ncbi:MAG TPA: hypothetical protein VLH08_03415, partial [Acidobacteriota bacterium]|nr:hypothetical protein [Acidobacteriota bacterium]